MKKSVLLLFVFTLMASASNAQSLGEAILDALTGSARETQKQNERNKTIDAGGQVAFSVPRDVLREDIKSHHWSVSDNNKLRIVSSDKTSCIVRGIASTPSTVVTYKYYIKVFVDGKEKEESRTVNYTVKVNKVAPTSMTVTQERTVGWGCYEQIRPSLKPDYSEAALSYTSENPDIVKVSNGGRIYGVALGDTYVNVLTDNGLEAETHVTVVIPQVNEINITGYDKKMKLYDGDQLQLGYTYGPAHAEPSVRWQSSDSQIATVDENGLVTFVGNGTVHIYCIDRTGTKADLKLKPKKNKDKD